MCARRLTSWSHDSTGVYAFRCRSGQGQRHRVPGHNLLRLDVVWCSRMHIRRNHVGGVLCVAMPLALEPAASRRPATTTYIGQAGGRRLRERAREAHCARRDGRIYSSTALRRFALVSDNEACEGMQYEYITTFTFKSQDLMLTPINARKARKHGSRAQDTMLGGVSLHTKKI